MKTSENTVLITGGGSGIGLALAERFAREGNRLVLVGRNADKLRAAAEKIGGAEIFAGDIGDENAAREMAERFPEVNVLINNAAVQYNYSLADTANGEAASGSEKIKQELDINLTGPILLIQNFLPVLMKRRDAAIVNITTGLIYAPKESAPIYCAGKAGLSMYTRALRYQLEAHDIRVFELIAPLVDTDMTRGRGRGKISPAELTDEFWRDFARDRFIMRIGKVKLLYLLSRLVPNIAYKIMRGGL